MRMKSVLTSRPCLKDLSQAYTYTYIHTHTHTHTKHTCTHTYIYIHTHTHTNTYINRCVYRYVCVHVYIYTYIVTYILAILKGFSRFSSVFPGKYWDSRLMLNQATTAYFPVPSMSLFISHPIIRRCTHWPIDSEPRKIPLGIQDSAVGVAPAGALRSALLSKWLWGVKRPECQAHQSPPCSAGMRMRGAKPPVPTRRHGEVPG
jgi:hypothetical protein